MKPNRVNAGFTLLEVVLAFTLFALLAAILYGAFAVGHRAVEKTQIVFERNQKFRSAVDLVGSYIHSSYPYRTSPRDPAVFFTGEENQLEFISAFSLAQGGRGMAKIRIYAEGPQRDGQTIKLEEQVPIRTNQEHQANAARVRTSQEEQESAAAISNTVVLRERVSDFRLTYLDPQNGLENWLEHWTQDEHQGMPRAVRMSYRNENGQEVRWTFPVMMMVLTP